MTFSLDQFLPHRPPMRLIDSIIDVDHEEARCVGQVTTKGTTALVDVMDQGRLPGSVAAKVADLPKPKQDKIAKAEKVKRLFLYHHDPLHSDKDMTKILAEARKQSNVVQLSFEGLELSF